MLHYSDLVDRVLLHDDLLEKLTPSEPSDRSLLQRIRAAEDSAIADGKAIGDLAAFRLVRGGLLYLVDAIDECHEHFQEVHTDLGSYWHGMMHRRESDFDNARYWFRRASRLPFFDTLHRRASECSVDMAKQMSWDPYLFTGQCEQARFGEMEFMDQLKKLQRAEFDVVFDYTWRQAKIE